MPKKKGRPVRAAFAAALGTVITVGSSVSAITPAEAAVTRKFVLYAGTTETAGNAVVQGTITWTRTTAVAKGWVKDICPQDGARASASIASWFRGGELGGSGLREDSDGCGNGRKYFTFNFGRLDQTRISKLGVSIAEHDYGDDGYYIVRDWRYREYDNPTW